MDDLSRQASIDGFQLNEAKCKELRIGFSNNNHDFEPLVLNGKPLELVTSAKLLGMIISHDLKILLIPSGKYSMPHEKLSIEVQCSQKRSVLLSTGM